MKKKREFTNDSAYAKALKNIQDLIRTETEDLNDIDYVNLCEELASDLDARAEAKKEEMDRS